MRQERNLEICPIPIINDAYDRIRKERASGGSASGGQQQSYGGTQASGGYGNYYGGSSRGYTGAGAEQFAAIRSYINQNRLAEARAVLNGMDASLRGAEWYFLMGCVLIRCGNYTDAGRCFDYACEREPDNEEYRNAREELRERSSAYRSAEFTPGCGSICTALLCADCCRSCFCRSSGC